MSLGFPLKKLFFFLSRRGKELCLCCVFYNLPEKEILYYIAHLPITQIFTVVEALIRDLGGCKFGGLARAMISLI